MSYYKFFSISIFFILLSCSFSSILPIFAISNDFSSPSFSGKSIHSFSTSVNSTPFSYSHYNLNFSSFLGGSGNDFGQSLAVDNAGNMIITGGTNSFDFPTKNAFQSSLGNNGISYHTNPDAFLTKFSSSGQLLFSTYFGGNYFDSASGVAVDSSGNIFITGSTSSSNFPTKNAFQSNLSSGSYNGLNDAFISEFNASGSLVFSTYLGGSGNDAGISIAIDAQGNCYITGITDSSNFPLLNAYQSVYNGNSSIFLAKFSSSGQLLFSSYFGESIYYNLAITVDSASNIFLTGATNSPSFPIKDAFQPHLAGIHPTVFISKFNSTGYLEFSSYFGGSGGDKGTGIAVDNSDNVYVTGFTYSNNFPVKNAAYPSLNTNTLLISDAFISKFNSSFGLVFSTYLGGSSFDGAFGVTIDQANNVYITGLTGSSNFPTKNAYSSTYRGGGDDVFLTKFDSYGNLIFSTYFGGNDSDNSYGIVSDSSGMIYLTGNTFSSNFPTENAYNSTFSGDSNSLPPIGDAFIARFIPIPSSSDSLLSTSSMSLSLINYFGFVEYSIIAFVILYSRKKTKVQ